jgi:hypothetical protein
MHIEEIAKSTRASGGHLLLAMAGPPSIPVAMAANSVVIFHKVLNMSRDMFLKF